MAFPKEGPLREDEIIDIRTSLLNVKRIEER
jgi:hypothetical protein